MMTTKPARPAISEKSETHRIGYEVRAPAIKNPSESHCFHSSYASSFGQKPQNSHKKITEILTQRKIDYFNRAWEAASYSSMKGDWDRLFKRPDREYTDSVSHEETLHIFRNVFKMPASILTNNEIKLLFDSIEKNLSGDVSKDDFFSFLHKFQKLSSSIENSSLYVIAGKTDLIKQLRKRTDELKQQIQNKEKIIAENGRDVREKAGLLAKCVEEIEKLNTVHKGVIEQLIAAHKKDKDKLNECNEKVERLIASHKEEIQKLTASGDGSSRIHEETNDLISQLRRRNGELEEKIRCLQKQMIENEFGARKREDSFAQFSKETINLSTSHKEGAVHWNAMHKEEMARWNASHIDEMEKLNAAHKEDEEQWNAAHKEKIDQLNNTHREEIEQWEASEKQKLKIIAQNSDLVNQLGSRNDDLVDKILNMENSKAGNEDEIKKKLKKLNTAHKKERDKWNAVHTIEVAQLNNTRKELKNTTQELMSKKQELMSTNQDLITVKDDIAMLEAQLSKLEVYISSYALVDTAFEALDDAIDERSSSWHNFFCDK